MKAVKEYDARMDMKKRVTLRGGRFDHYHVKEYDDGRIMLEPRELATPLEISKRTLSMMDTSMENLKQGKVSGPIDLEPHPDDKKRSGYAKVRLSSAGKEE